MEEKLAIFIKDEFGLEAEALKDLPQEKKQELYNECHMSAMAEVTGQGAEVSERFRLLLGCIRLLGYEESAAELEKFGEETAAAGGAPPAPKRKNEAKAAEYNDKGYVLATGRGKKINYAKALKWFKKAARLGDLNAMNNIGATYERNIGVKQDYRKAMKWYLKAAGFENACAMSNIGNLYEQGLGVAVDYALARKWYEKASRRGETYATVKLGYLYEDGRGVKKDYAKALALYQEAAAKGSRDGISYLGGLYYAGKGVEKDYARAMELFWEAANKGCKESLTTIAMMYAKGQGVEQDYAYAVELFEEAAEYDGAWATCMLGRLALKGRGCDRDYAKAFACIRKAAALGQEDAIRGLAYMYARGCGVQKDMAEALKLLRKAQQAGDKKAAKVLRLYGKYCVKGAPEGFYVDDKGGIHFVEYRPLGAPEGFYVDDKGIWDAKLLNKAVTYATKMHKGQLRKGKPVPYITHPLEVMSILYRMGADSDLMVAGLLHDVVEDTDATYEDIAVKFGRDIASLVAAHSEDKAKPWRERKEENFRAIAAAEDKRVRLLVMADKLANMRDIAQDYAELGDRLWERFNAGKEEQKWYYTKSAEVLKPVAANAQAAWAYEEYAKLVRSVFGAN